MSTRTFGRGCPNWRPTAARSARRSRGERPAQLSRRHQILPADPWRGGAARNVHRPRHEMDGQQEAAAGHSGRQGREPRQGHGRRRHRRPFPDSDLVAQPRRPRRRLDRDRDDPRLSPAHGRFLRAIPRPSQEPDRRLDAPASTRRCARSANGASRNGRSRSCRCSPRTARGSPDLEPIWQEAQEYDLPIANHSFTWTPPYYPGYRDL